MAYKEIVTKAVIGKGKKKYTNKYYNLCNVTKEIIGKPVLSSNLIETLNKVYKKTYNQENIGYYYQKGINNARVIYNIRTASTTPSNA